MIGTELDGLHGEIDGAMPGENDDRQLGVVCLEVGDDVDGDAVRKFVVEDGRIGLPLGHLPPRAAQVAGLDHLQAAALEVITHGEAERGLVIDQ